VRDRLVTFNARRARELTAEMARLQGGGAAAWGSAADAFGDFADFLSLPDAVVVGGGGGGGAAAAAGSGAAAVVARAVSGAAAAAPVTAPRARPADNTAPSAGGLVFVPSNRRVAPFDPRLSLRIVEPSDMLTVMLPVTPIATVLQLCALAMGGGGGLPAGAQAGTSWATSNVGMLPPYPPNPSLPALFRVRARLVSSFPSNPVHFTTRVVRPNASAAATAASDAAGDSPLDLRGCSGAATDGGADTSGGGMGEDDDGEAGVAVEHVGSRGGRRLPQAMPAALLEELPASAEWAYAFCLRLDDRSGGVLDALAFGRDAETGLFAGALPACDLVANTEAAAALDAVLRRMHAPHAWLDVALKAYVAEEGGVGGGSGDGGGAGTGAAAGAAGAAGAAAAAVAGPPTRRCVRFRIFGSHYMAYEYG
jgi:hypothetical protein